MTTFGKVEDAAAFLPYSELGEVGQYQYDPNLRVYWGAKDGVIYYTDAPNEDLEEEMKNEGVTPIIAYLQTGDLFFRTHPKEVTQ